MKNHDVEELIYLQRQKRPRGLGERKRRGMEDHVVKRASSAWHGTAFIVEAVVLLLVMTVSLGVVVSLLAASYSMGSRAQQQACAATLASTGAANGAEAFSADPAHVPQTTYYRVTDGVVEQVDHYLAGHYVVACEVSPEKTDGGTLYRAQINVSRYNQVVYALSTATYVSGGRG